MEDAGCSIQRLADALGISYQAVKKAVEGKTKAFSAENNAKTAQFLGVPSEWLATGQAVIKSAYTGTHLVVAGIRVELLANSASMGIGSEEHDSDALCGHITLTESFTKNRIKPTGLEALKFIHAYGDSMEPTFSSGDILLVDTGIIDVKIDGVYVLRAHDRLFVKRVRQRIDGHFEISSDNPTHRTVDVLNGDHHVSVIGRVLWAWNGRRM